jgi:uncharacterized C2H2 Zn-finger protein
MIAAAVAVVDDYMQFLHARIDTTRPSTEDFELAMQLARCMNCMNVLRNTKDISRVMNKDHHRRIFLEATKFSAICEE